MKSKPSCSSLVREGDCAGAEAAGTVVLTASPGTWVEGTTFTAGLTAELAATGEQALASIKTANRMENFFIFTSLFNF